jgi:hypothetical protein
MGVTSSMSRKHSDESNIYGGRMENVEAYLDKLYTAKRSAERNG